MMKRILIVGGANGIGLSIATEMAKKNDCEKIYIVDKAKVEQEYIHPKFEISEGIESIRPTGQPDDKLQHFKYGTEIVQTTTT